MKARPILFSAPMVRALLDGRKTQTRRVVKFNSALASDFMADKNASDACPHGKPGDLLWVRETTCSYPLGESGLGYIAYAADKDKKPDGYKWKPSIFMPRFASRLTLEITDVRVERLQAISEADAWAEGVASTGVCYGIEVLPSTATGIERYAALWREINGQASWDANPWVWVIEFKVHHCNVDQLLRERGAA